MNKIYSKFLTLIIVFTMILTVFSIPTAAVKAAEVVDFSEAVEALNAFGVLEKTDMYTDSAISRGDFVSVVCNIFGVEFSEKYPASVKFSDVNSEDKIYTAVSVATDLGLLSGYGDGTFRPDAQITKTQVAKIVVTLLGYEPIASTYGGYPSGYLTVASMNNILKGVDMSGAEECTWGEAIKILYNALEVDLMKNAKYPVAEYHVVEGSNILNSWLHIYKVEGVVQANDFTSLTDVAGVSEGKVKIGGSIFDEGKTKASELLGYRVKAFYKENEASRNELVFTALNENYKLIRVSPKDVNVHTFDRMTVFNDKTGKYDEYIIAAANIIYNNKRISRGIDSADKLKPAEGNIELLDNNNDGTIDVVLIKEYSVFFVNTVNANTYVITNKYSNERIELDPENKELEYEIIKDGTEVGFDAIEPDTVISIIKSPVSDGKTYVQVIIGTERFAGKVTEISDDTIFINGEEFEIFDAVRSQVAKLDVTDKSLFYLTYDGKIGGFGQIVSGGEQYGYLTGAGCVKKSGIGSERIATLRLFSLSERALMEYDTAERFSINGNRFNSEGRPYDGRDLVDILYATGSFEHQLVKYRLNDKDRIESVEFARRYAVYPYFPDGTEPVNQNTLSPSVDYEAIETDYKGYDTDNFSCDYIYVSKKFLHSNSENYRHYKDFEGGLFDNRYLSASGTIIEVPTTYDGDLVNEEYIQVPSVYPDDSQLRFYEVYDSDEYYNAKVIIVRPVGGGNSTNLDLMHFIFDKMTSVSLEDGTKVKKIYGYYNGEYKKYTVSEKFTNEVGETFFSSFRRGDVFKLGIDVSGQIGNMKKMFTLGNNSDSAYKMDINGYNLINQSDANQAYFRINIESATSHIRATALNGSILRAKFYKVNAGLPLLKETTYVVYDEKTDTLRKGDASDISPGDDTQSLVTRAIYGGVHQVYIINRTSPYYPTWVGSTSDYN